MLEVLAARVDDLMFAADDDTLTLIASDPAMLSVLALDEFSGGAAQPAFDQGTTQYLIVEAATPAYELGAQTALVADIRAALPEPPNARILGSPVYAVDLQRDVRFQATLFSTLAGLALLALMIARYRSVQRVIAVALPLARAARSVVC